MQETEIKALVDAQRAFFYSGATLPLDYRVEPSGHWKRSSAIMRRTLPQR